MSFNMREQFEKLPEIAIHLEHGNVFFDEEKQTYASEFPMLHFVACYVNGAWYAYQDQKNKIDKVINEARAWHTLTGNALGLKIQELLK